MATIGVLFAVYLVLKTGIVLFERRKARTTGFRIPKWTQNLSLCVAAACVQLFMF